MRNNPIANFLQGRRGDFKKMGGSGDVQAFGPPAILLGGYPMPADAVRAALPPPLREIRLVRLTDDRMDDTLRDVLDGDGDAEEERGGGGGGSDDSWAVPLIFFSGISNADLRTGARALVGGLYAATGQRAAFAKVVPPALGKTMGQLVTEITGDHLEALAKMDANVEWNLDSRNPEAQ